MNEKERLFVDSIKKKISDYNIPITIKEAVQKGKNIFKETKYTSGKTEIIDVGIENFLCEKSPAYFIDRYCYISVPNLGIIPFNMYYFQKEVLKEIPIYRKYVFLKTRQSGISTLIAFYCLWRCLFRTSESIAVVSKKKDAAQDFLAKMKVTLEVLPDFIKVPLEIENMSHLVFANRSEIKSEARSPGAGRSSTLSLLVLDEAAFYGSENMVRSIVASAQPTLTRTGGSMIIISTPNGSTGEGGYYFEQVNQLRMSGNTKTEKLTEIDWFEVPDIEGIFPQKGYNKILGTFINRNYFNDNSVRKEMRNFFRPIEEKWKENEWLMAQHKDLGDALFRQEILHDFVIMGNSVFGTETMEKVKQKVSDPISIDRLGNSVIKGLWIWKKPEPKKRYIIGVDVSKGTGKDSSTIEILDAENYEQVAEYIGFVSTPEFSRIIKKLANYYNQGFVVIESNGIGEAVFNGVYHDQTEPYQQVYKQKISRNGITVITGWITDVKTRQLITNQLIDWFNVDELFDNFKVYSSRIYNQMNTWIWTNNGRADHTQGCVSGDTIITCKNGFKQIKDITVGDYVLTHTGEFKEVTKTFKFKDETKKMLDVRFFGKQKLNITSNHKLYLKKENKIDFICFDDIYQANKYKSTSLFSTHIEEINNDIFNNKLFLFFLGHILSDGSVSKENEITITSHKDECDYIFNLYAGMLNDIGINNIKVYEYKNFKRLRIYDNNLFSVVKSIGTKENKDIIDELRYINPILQKYILLGYIFGDGSFYRKRTGKLTMNSISFKLSYYIQSILFRNKIQFNISKIQTKRFTKNTKDQYSITILGKELLNLFKENDFAEVFNYKNNYNETINYVKEKNQVKTTKLSSYDNNGILINTFNNVEKIDWDDYLYDLEVDRDHSYVANGIVVHNSHDDALIALALALYHRDKAINAGQSFIVGEDGKLIDYSVRDRLTAATGSNKEWDFMTSEQEGALDEFEKKTGVSVDQYSWLIGGMN